MIFVVGVVALAVLFGCLAIGELLSDWIWGDEDE